MVERLMDLNISALKARGWTDSAIQKFLGEPDKVKKNPHYSTASPMRLYNPERVRAVEESEEWKSWLKGSLEKREKLSDIQIATAKEKRKRVIAYAISNIEYSFPEKKPTPQNVVDHWRDQKAAFESSRNRLSDDFYRSNTTPETIDDQTLQRWTYNMLRHEYTNYDELCCWLKGETGKDEAYEELRIAVDSAICKYLEEPPNG